HSAATASRDGVTACVALGRPDSFPAHLDDEPCRHSRLASISPWCRPGRPDAATLGYHGNWRLDSQHALHPCRNSCGLPGRGNNKELATKKKKHGRSDSPRSAGAGRTDSTTINRWRTKMTRATLWHFLAAILVFGTAAAHALTKEPPSFELVQTIVLKGKPGKL